MAAVAVGYAFPHFDTIGHGLHDFSGVGDRWISDALVIELDGVS